MEWKTVNICDMCDSISATYSRGADMVVLINTSDVLDGKFLNREKVPNKDLKGQFKKTFKRDDILYSEIRPANKRFAYVDFDAIDYIASTKLMVLRAKPNVNPRFLYHILKSEDTLERLQMLAESRSGTFPQITYSEMENVSVLLPDRETQDKIVAILSSLDDKIENNNRINRNLEEQAQALFKSWFVDFEPFNDSKLVESELGFIPAKWHIEPFSSLINFQEGPGIRNWQYVTENGTKFINIRCIKDGDIFTETANMISNEEANGKYAHFMLREGDIVMSCSGTLGRYAIVRKDHLPLCLNTSVIRFFPIYKNDYSYIWGLLTSSYFLNKQIEMAAGSVQANFGPTHLKQIKILVPDEINREQFNKICYPILFEIQRRRYENKRLAALRDTLLPKLMKGEITL